MNSVDMRLYGILDPSRCAIGDLAEAAREAAAGGVTLLQLRDKTGSTRDMVAATRAIVAALEGTGVPLLVNDRVDVALAAGAQGVHLGQDDMQVADARRLLGPDAIIGLTIKFAAHVDNAPFEAIDYCAVGGVFETLSKKNPDAPVGLDGLTALADRIAARDKTMPVCAIAGIDLERTASVIHAGAGGISVISAIFMQDDIAGGARALREAVNAALKMTAA